MALKRNNQTLTEVGDLFESFKETGIPKEARQELMAQGLSSEEALRAFTLGNAFRFGFSTDSPRFVQMAREKGAFDDEQFNQIIGQTLPTFSPASGITAADRRARVEAGEDLGPAAMFRLRHPDAEERPIGGKGFRRQQGERIEDFTKRIETGDSVVLTPEQQEQYFASQRGATNPLSPAEFLAQNQTSTTQPQATQATGPRPQPGQTTPVVGTSAGARTDDIKSRLGIGEAPKVPNLTEQFQQLRESAGISETQNELAEIMDARLAIQDEMQKFQDELVGLPEAGRVGAVGEKGRELQRRLDVLNRRELVLETKLSNQNNTISQIMQLTQSDFSNAMSAYNTKFSQALQLNKLFEDEQDEIKQNAKANLDVLANAFKAQIESGQITNLTGLQKEQLHALETQAGLPIGSTEAVLSSLKPAEEKLWSGIDDFGNFKYIYRDVNGNIGVRTATGAVPQDGGGGSSGGQERITEPNQEALETVQFVKQRGGTVENAIQALRGQFGLGRNDALPTDVQAAVNEVFPGSFDISQPQRASLTELTPSNERDLQQARLESAGGNVQSFFLNTPSVFRQEFARQVALGKVNTTNLTLEEIAKLYDEWVRDQGSSSSGRTP